ncbi:MAG: hypothetical protein KU29_06985 [Sulfurovum sp. FS06-10]|nr:MAG: hypothetical protein KU29_06985 [Sulfurovum sp. FS06-10]
MYQKEQKKLSFLQWTSLVSLVAFYPILVSIYTMLPPLIGLVGYIVVTNMDKNRIYALAGMLYLVNLDLNLTLPLLLSVFMVVMVQVLIYPRLKRLIYCQVCLFLILIVVIDFLYYFSLFIYDFIFNSSTIIADVMLIFYIVVDVMIGVLL